MLEPKIYTIPLDSGELVQIKTVSPIIRQLLLTQIQTDFPEPDPEPYRKPLVNALDESLKEEATENPEYIKARNKAIYRQNISFCERLIRMGVVIAVDGEPQAETLARFADALALARGAVAGLPEDDWTACVLACLVVTDGDLTRVSAAANEALSQEDIAKAASSFRREVQRRGRVATADESQPSGVPAPTGTR